MECAPSIAGCFAAAEETMGAQFWTPTTQVQSDNIGNVSRITKVVREVFKPGELDVLATFSAKEMTQFFKERNFDFKIQPYGGSNFGLGAVLKLALEWHKAGKPTEIVRANEKFEGVLLKADDHLVHFYDCDGHESPLAEITAKNGDRVFVTEFYGDVDEVFGFSAAATQLSKKKRRVSTFGSLAVPMVDLVTETDLDWMIGINAQIGGSVYTVSDASQKNRLKLNLKGALAESATHMAMRGGCFGQPKKKMVIENPFLFWIERDGLNAPAFTAYVSTDTWKNPGEIQF